MLKNHLNYPGKNSTPNFLWKSTEWGVEFSPQFSMGGALCWRTAIGGTHLKPWFHFYKLKFLHVLIILKVEGRRCPELKINPGNKSSCKCRWRRGWYLSRLMRGWDSYNRSLSQWAGVNECSHQTNTVELYEPLFAFLCQPGAQTLDVRCECYTSSRYSASHVQFLECVRRFQRCPAFVRPLL